MMSLSPAGRNPRKGRIKLRGYIVRWARCFWFVLPVSFFKIPIMTGPQEEKKVSVKRRDFLGSTMAADFLPFIGEQKWELNHA